VGTIFSKRGAGILLAVSSLPSPYGIGTFGAAALRWIDFLSDAGQSFWQILPLGPTGWGDSPYQSFSAFALSPYYIDLDLLVEAGLLSKNELETVDWGASPAQVDYSAQYHRRFPVLRSAFSRFNYAENTLFQDFCAKNDAWLADYALFMAIKQREGGKSWLEWGADFKNRLDAALKSFAAEYENEINFQKFLQFMARSQWEAVKSYANSKGIFIIGDIPIYVALDSADLWAQPQFFQLDADRQPSAVAGCPPDYFSAGGQLWGNPLYNWEAIKKTGFAWWLSRLKLTFSLFDGIRIDHFRGFESYFSIPPRADDARGGHWEKGPGMDFIEAVKKEWPNANIIAEDLGFLTPEVRRLLAESGFPGMKLLQFAFDSREESDYMPWTYPQNSVAYTGTHDNPTTQGWFASAPAEDVKLAKDFLFIRSEADAKIAHEYFIRTVLASAANTAIIPMQDYLGLGLDARMNTPATTGLNWQWRLLPTAPSPALAAKIHHLTKRHRRFSSGLQ
jgi:4-alpha-glucanotransferase